jgi:transposase
MNCFNYFIGIDVSKATLDVALVKDGKQVFYEKLDNKPQAIKQLLKRLLKQCGDLSQILFCMECTGVYNNHLLQILGDEQLAVWMESAIQIKRSMGIQRGKNDKADSQKIALYAFKNRYDIKLWEPSREQLQKLKQLMNIRTRLIRTKSNLKKPLLELSFHSPLEQKIFKNSYKATLKAIDKDIIKVDAEINKTIQEDQLLRRLMDVVTSVKGIGRVTAVQVIVTTNEFKSITEAKKFACYAGVAPFEHSSGTSVRGRTRVSKMADVSMKCNLHMAALASIRGAGDLQDYFLRKIEEGKNKMSVLNAIRNKLIHRIFACVREDRFYSPKVAELKTDLILV